jgi:uncharacterized membrane protein YtjA (UPF0391 family)
VPDRPSDGADPNFAGTDHAIESHERFSEREAQMLYYALVFLLVGIVAGVLGLTGISVIATQISWILFLISLVLLVVHFVKGRRPRTL